MQRFLWTGALWLGASPAVWAEESQLAFCSEHLNNLLGIIIIVACIGINVYRAKGRQLFIRTLPALGSFKEAIGRATELGKPVLYVPGVADIDDIQTLSSMPVLEHVAREVTAYDTPLLVPNCCSMVLTMTQEIVQNAYSAAGHPDTYQSDYVRYLSDEQFSFAAGVSGIMVRQQPGAIFYVGNFFSEALILSETGNSTGAIQIAGTAQVSQLPFFVASCDYTLIGEELYAASAYLSQDPLNVGSLKGQDLFKIIFTACLIVGCILVSLGYTDIIDLLATN